MKNYQQPESRALSLSTESMLAASVGYNDSLPIGDGENIGKQYSNRQGGWNSEDWQGEE